MSETLSRIRAREVEPRTRVFVYGTLLAGERNCHLLEGARHVAEARTQPAFTLYDFGGCPGMITGGNHSVPGEVYEVDEPALAAMDWLEAATPGSTSARAFASKTGRPSRRTC